MHDAQTIFSTSVLALGNRADIEAIHTISAIADCSSPRGTYITEIHSGRGARVWFQQTRSGQNPTTVVITPGGAWATDPVTRETEALDAASISMVRGHEFQMIPLTLAERYSSPGTAGEAVWNDVPCLVVTALDDLGFECKLYFRAADLRWEGSSLTDARRPGSHVKIVVNEWRRIAGVQMPGRVTATDSTGEYCLDFKEIRFNVTDEARFAVPPTPARVN